MSSHAIQALPRATRRRLLGDRVVRRWVAAWVGASLLGVMNGALRELVYSDYVGESTANQISVASLIALLAGYFWLLDRRWPIPTRAMAFAIGGAWAALTVAFEFLFGHYVDGDSWSQLLENYDLVHGRLWLLVLAWIAVGPAVIRRLRRGTGATA